MPTTTDKPEAYAIDFGTSNSLVAAANRERIFAPIPLDPANTDPTVFRSVLFFPNMKQVFYGAEAIKQFYNNQGDGRLIRSIKKYLPSRTFVGTYVEDRPVNLEDLIGFFLAEIRRRANAHFQADVKRVVLGRPAKFAPDDADDRYAEYRLEQSALKAGFTDIVFCPEPVAAAYDYRETSQKSEIVLVADFGGGTSDFTVIRLENGRKVEVLGMSGVSLAGDALDGELMRHKLVDSFGADLNYKVPFGSNVLTMPGHLMEKLCSAADIALLGKRDTLEFLRTLQKWTIEGSDKVKLDRLFTLIDDQLGFPLFECIEKAKRDLSLNDQALIEYDYPRIDLKEKVTRTEFEGFIDPEVKGITAALDETLAMSGVKLWDISRVCCTGGTAKVPRIHEELVKRFGAAKVQDHKYFHSVVEGLSHRAKEWITS